MKRAIAVATTIAVMVFPTMLAAQTPIAPGAEQIRRHEQINLFEGTLERAVTNAARRVAKDVQSHTSNANFITSDARAKGFILDGYGVFVYVEIPALDLTLSLMLDQLDRDAPQRAEADQGKPEANPVSNRPEVKAEPSPVIPKAARETLKSVMDTGEKYRNEVKLHLTDAMLDFTKNLELKPDEWLSVAARGSDGALTPGEILQLTTVVLRVKGSDLADYFAGRLTREEARAKVEVRQF
ncbi:MAG: hypothetical protein ACJ731_13630 [Vicinamibacterales bacterium]